jgi:hypothetical protein
MKIRRGSARLTKGDALERVVGADDVEVNAGDIEGAATSPPVEMRKPRSQCQ